MTLMNTECCTSHSVLYVQVAVKVDFMGYYCIPSGYVSFSFLPNGGQNEILWIIGGGKYVFVCKACGKLGGSGGMLPWETLTLDLY